MTITELSKLDDRNQYGELQVDFKATIHAAYPKVKIRGTTPGAFGHTGDFSLWNAHQCGYWRLTMPEGNYSSQKHYHSAGHGIIAIESGRKKHNTRPLFLLTGRAFNGDYKSLKKTYWLFGANEDESYFLHKIRPKFAESGNMEEVRKWLWELKEGETIAARQGDIVFIPKKRRAGKKATVSFVDVGNHRITGDKIYRTKHKLYALNPQTCHAEHHPVKLEGLFEVRMAKVWKASQGD